MTRIKELNNTVNLLLQKVTARNVIVFVKKTTLTEHLLQVSLKLSRCQRLVEAVSLLFRGC